MKLLSSPPKRKERKEDKDDLSSTNSILGDSEDWKTKTPPPSARMEPKARTSRMTLPLSTVAEEGAMIGGMKLDNKHKALVLALALYSKKNQSVKPTSKRKVKTVDDKEKLKQKELLPELKRLKISNIFTVNIESDNKLTFKINRNLFLIHDKGNITMQNEDSLNDNGKIQLIEFFNN
jgi:hypothetical protein